MELAIASILKENRRTVVTIGPEATLQEAARRMNEERIGSLVVVDDRGEIQGILSERDIMRRFADSEDDSRGIEVRHVMTPKEKLIVGQGRDTVEQLMAVMTRNQVRHIPILSDSEPFRLEGMISIGDLVKARLTDTHAENRLLQDYISGRYPR
ncbi:MAG: CBS domain-containing protein [Candidatus Aminicenantes bacterium]|nr:CBS domain-containing protein [Candidatus Aminicenantes bacterium]